jgi:hypothetical protein
MWAVIDEFPEYSVSDRGEVRRDDTGNFMSIGLNQYGVAQVSLMKGGTQYRRGVAKLVSSYFLEPHELSTFGTPINLNGDRSDNHVDNLMWRPRWFAVKYHRQFDEPPGGFREPIVDIATGEEFETSWEAAIKYGLLDREILIATLNRTYVWPTYQEFRTIE